MSSKSIHSSGKLRKSVSFSEDSTIITFPVYTPMISTKDALGKDLKYKPYCISPMFNNRRKPVSFKEQLGITGSILGSLAGMGTANAAFHTSTGMLFVAPMVLGACVSGLACSKLGSKIDVYQKSQIKCRYTRNN